MPYLQHQGVGRLLGYARSDHSIPIPRPAFDQQLGIENACQKCHQDKGIAWQETAMKIWYGDIKPHPRAISSLLRARDVTEPGAAAQLLLLPEENHPMAQAAGLGTWIERFLQPNATAGADEAIPRLMQLARSNDTDVQSFALLALHVGFDDRAEVRSFLSEQLKSLDGRDDAVRRRWAVAADNLGSLFMQRGDLKGALACLEKSLEVLHDSVVILSHLSLARLRSGDTAGAVAALQQAIQVEPHKAALHFQLAQIYAQAGQTSAALGALESGLQYAPNDAKALQMLETLRRP
jgi:tetratricopeptide (TPR) repeat protein